MSLDKWTWIWRFYLWLLSNAFNCIVQSLSWPLHYQHKNQQHRTFHSNIARNSGSLYFSKYDTMLCIFLKAKVLICELRHKSSCVCNVSSVLKYWEINSISHWIWFMWQDSLDNCIRMSLSLPAATLTQGSLVGLGCLATTKWNFICDCNVMMQLKQGQLTLVPVIFVPWMSRA